MPLYEYQCPRCGTDFEELVRTSEADQVSCPTCGEPKPVRKLSTFARGDDSAGTFSSSSCSSRGGFS